MAKILEKRSLIAAALALMLTGCTDDTGDFLSAFQRDLLGKSVNFNATHVGEFSHQSRATYNDTGVFNEDDLMRIYRQYAQNDGSWGEEAYRTYIHNTKYATGTTNLSLGTDWRVFPGRTGKDPDGTIITQEEKDSITWENGQTVRFRSWTRSNYANCLTSCYKYSGINGITNYYPDYCISDWVTVSGPTEEVPLSMRHICSRIAFSYRNNGSQFYKVEVATTLDDYKRRDNADTNENDNSQTEAGKTDAEAQQELDQVLAAYNRMCMPAGVDIYKSELYAMTQSYWGPLDKKNDADNLKLQNLEDEAPSNFYFFGDKNNDYIRDYVQRPVFANVNQSCYLITIPYDMSNGDTQGNIITLPPCTRFRVYLRDVNYGDAVNKGEYEGQYHIFTLSDIKKENSTEPAFPNGLEMNPGYSYKFYVGYRYDKLTITASGSFSWDVQDAEEEQLADAGQDMPVITTQDYTWWKTTLKSAIPKDGGDYNPVFHIKNQKQFLEFIRLVNGTATVKTDGLYRAKRSIPNEDHEGNGYDLYYWWYTSVSDNKRDTTWISSADATREGYLLYESYHAANGNQPAYSQEEYIRGSFPFYDETRDRHYTVYLDNDIDLADWSLASIGKASGTPFKGFFDGQMHTLTNVNMKDEYLFKYIDAAAISNLRLESTHKLSLVKEGKNTCYIVGVSILANSTRNSIAEKLTTNQYNNPSYVVGCIHVGDAGGALVGASGNLYMQGNMQAAYGIPSGSGALLGEYLDYSSPYAEDRSTWRFFDPQISFDYNNMTATLKGKPSWGRFMCNYYDTELSAGTNAIADIPDKYSPLEYIRGRKSYILKAKNDNLLRGEFTFNDLKNVDQRLAYYGLAPWKAMNYAIYRYNLTQNSSTNPHKCSAHYENNSTGYIHRYPILLPGEPTSDQYANPLDQKN